MDKETILNDVDKLTANQLFDAICNGTVTLDELIQTGKLDPEKFKAISLSLRDRQEEDVWNRCGYNEILLSKYIENYPLGKHVEEAKQRIRRRQGILNHVDILTANRLFNEICNGIVTLGDLIKTGRLDVSRRKTIEHLVDQRNKDDDKAWSCCGYNGVRLFKYIGNYPIGRHVEEAKQRINERQGILNEADRLTAEDLFNEICKGTVTLGELSKLVPIKREEIENLLSQRNREDEDAWNRCGYDEDFLSGYIGNYPDGRHVKEAKQRIAEKQRIIDSVNDLAVDPLFDAIRKGAVTLDEL
ncbi:MAG: hypothetical protein LBB62_00695, partial [Proteiniphilum sp.]|nr:hypothetical protein [Proteiniphilum sp.]